MQLDPDPEFIGTINNVTFPAGREAILACSVRNLGKNKASDVHNYNLCAAKHKNSFLVFTRWVG